MPGLFEQFTELGPQRIADMDAGGVTLQVISHGPGDLSPALCRECNDQLAKAVRSHPGRFAGFAELPMDEPGEAARELRRTCGGEMDGVKFVGALVDSHTESGVYYDGPEYDVLWKEATELDVPIYIHPTWPSEQLFAAYRSPHLPEDVTTAILAFGFGWHSDVAKHVLRLYAAGVFDRFPGLKNYHRPYGRDDPVHAPEDREGVFAVAKSEVVPGRVGYELLVDDERELVAGSPSLHSAEHQARQNHVQRGLPLCEECWRVEMAGRARGERDG